VRKIRVFLEYLAAFVIIFLLLFIIASTIVIKFYGDDLKTYALELVNEEIDTKASVGETGISVFRKFPNTSVYLNDVMIWSGHAFDRNQFPGKDTDTLFYADRVFLRFNMLDLLRKRFTVKSLEARGGKLTILIDEQGNTNFSIQKKTNQEEKTANIDIKGFIAREIDVNYRNLAKKLEAEGAIREMTFEGNFSKESYLLQSSADAFISSFTNHGVSYIKDQALQTDVLLRVNQNVFNIEKGKFDLGEISTTVLGSFLVDQEVGADLDLSFTGRKIDLAWLSEILALSKSGLEDVSAGGKADLDIHVSGLATSTLSPHIEAAYDIKNAMLKIHTLPLNVRAIQLSGTYSNGLSNSMSSSSLTLHSYNAEVDHSQIHGSLEVTNMLAPKFELQLEGEIEAADISASQLKLPLDFIKGQLIPEIILKGNIKGIAQKSLALELIPSGKIQIRDLSLYPNDRDLLVEELDGLLEIAGDRMQVDLTGRTGNTDFTADLALSNTLAFISKNDVLNLRGSLESTAIDLDQLLAGLNSKNKSGEGINYPDKLLVDLDFQFGQLKKGDIKTKKVNGNFTYKYPAAYLDPLYLETMNGAINASIAMIDLHREAQKLRINANYRNVEIADIFTTFNNFKQDFITDKNIAGKLSGETEFMAELGAGGEIPASEIYSRNSFVIENGYLRDFQPLIELSDFLKIDKMNEVAFSTLSNTILIENNAITIPQMDINSSAFNLQASGYHHFDKTFEYHVATKLSEILFNKAKSTGKEEFTIALDTEDKRTLFLLIYDEGQGVMVDFDEEQAMKKIRQDIKQERNVLKKVLNKEFGLFDKDEEVQEDQETPKEPLMQFEFDPVQETDSLDKKEEEKPKWWQRKKDTDKKAEFEFVIDDNMP